MLHVAAGSCVLKLALLLLQASVCSSCKVSLSSPPGPGGQIACWTMGTNVPDLCNRVAGISVKWPITRGMLVES